MPQNENEQMATFKQTLWIWQIVNCIILQLRNPKTVTKLSFERKCPTFINGISTRQASTCVKSVVTDEERLIYQTPKEI